MRDPRQEAFDRLDGEAEVRVLEPSPPADVNGPWFADDPAARGDVPPGRTLVGPTSAADMTWQERAANDEALAAWCSQRWLAAWPRLPDLPGGWPAAYGGPHALAEHILSAARHAANGKIGLRWTRGGFGTPFFRRGDQDVQVRVEGTELVLTEGGKELRSQPATLREAAQALGIEAGAPTEVFAPTTPLDPDAPLSLTADVMGFLDAWYGFATSVLEELRAQVQDTDSPSRVQLWPEHFDLALDAGDADKGQRANYGASPGDGGHPTPYLYVGPWDAPEGDGWNAPHFPGAVLSLAQLAAADDQREAALAFFSERRAELLDPDGS